MNNSHSDRELSYKPRWITPFLEEYSETSIGIIIHTGNEVKYLSQKILAMPWIMFTGMIQTVSLARSTSFEYLTHPHLKLFNPLTKIRAFESYKV